jgi:hypothetical protein
MISDQDVVLRVAQGDLLVFWGWPDESTNKNYY